VKEYYEMLEKNREFFEKVFDIAKDIAEKAKKLHYNDFLFIALAMKLNAPIWMMTDMLWLIFF